MRNKLAQQIKHSLSLKLSLSILAFTVIIFMITIGIIFFRSRHFVRQTAIPPTIPPGSSYASRNQIPLHRSRVAFWN